MPNSPKTRVQWKNLIEQQRASELAPLPFCERQQVNIHRFYYYRGILFPKAVKRLKKPSPFVVLKATDHSSDDIVTLNIGAVNITVKRDDIDFIAALCLRLSSP